MRAVLAAILVLVALPSFAAERVSRPVIVEPQILPAPLISPHRNPQAQAVAASRECFRDCQIGCKADFLACGYQSSGAECLSVTDRCDRACQRQCRSTGDPIIDWPRPFD